MKINKLLESKKIKEEITNTEPVVKFQGKSSHTFTKDKKWEVDFDEAGNILARTRHGKPSYFKGHINDKVNDFPSTDEDNIILAAREQHGLKFGNKEVKEGWSHFEFTSGNPYIAKTKAEVERIKRSRGDSVRYVGNINGIDYYKVDDSEEDLFRVDESVQMTNDELVDILEKSRYTSFVVDEGDYIKIQGTWRPNSRKCHNDYVGISSLLDKKLGNGNFDLVYEENTSRDGGNEFSCKLRLKVKQLKEGWYEDHLDTIQRKTSGYYKCYKIVKKARTSNPIDTDALDDARDHFGYDLYKMCLDDVLKEMGNLGESFNDFRTDDGSYYIIGDCHYFEPKGIPTMKSEISIKDYRRAYNNRKLNSDGTDNLEEAFKPSDSGIQSVKCYNRYNYTIQELRVDNDNKTFERGNFTAGKADKKTKNRQEFEDVVDTLKELGYTEIKSDYRSMRNKSRKGNPTNESFPTHSGINLDRVVMQVANLLMEDKLGDNWIEFIAARDARPHFNGEYIIFVDCYGPTDSDYRRVTLTTNRGDIDVKFRNGSEAKCQDVKEIARFIAGEYGVGLNESMEQGLTKSKSIKEARRKASDPKQIEKAEKSMLDSLMNGAYNTEWMIQDAKMIYGISYDEAVKAFRNAHNKYMIMSGELDESKESEESELITQYINNGEFDKLEKVHNGTNVVWKLKEPINSIDESKSLNEFAYKTDDLKAFYNTSTSIDKEKYPNFFVWYDEMVKSGKIKVNEEVKDNGKINEASYGGAFDIADDQYFTRDDLNDFAEEVLNHINETFKTPFDVSSCYIDNGILELCVTNDEYGDYIYSEKIDMRKIKEPWHLKRAYAFEFASQLINDITQSNDGLVESFDDDVDDLSYYYSEEDIIDALNDVWEEIASKSVADSDGFMTDYTMYRNINTGEYVFVFGDKDIYRPEDGYFDWECETEEEAKEWFDNYNGFDESDDDIDWMNEEAEGESPILHKKGDGSYLVASENGDGYTAFNKSDVCIGHITASDENEAKSKFNSNQFDE